jgi:hypothetical protein
MLSTRLFLVIIVRPCIKPCPSLWQHVSLFLIWCYNLQPKIELFQPTFVTPFLDGPNNNLVQVRNCQLTFNGFKFHFKALPPNLVLLINWLIAIFLSTLGHTIHHFEIPFGNLKMIMPLPHTPKDLAFSYIYFVILRKNFKGWKYFLLKGEMVCKTLESTYQVYLQIECIDKVVTRGLTLPTIVACEELSNLFLQFFFSLWHFLSNDL